ncbi:tyrosine-type recombinase/integrase [Nocardioides caldifontis]|uniref:tyrosine-type recombinase/integrase n=1 Tax=Nocardioides caldifontis TaxID=2588938 RepID=UPI0011E01CDF|nr:tyrosine-type recombinase/integrase [Nocardioides caldifontis]
MSPPLETYDGIRIYAPTGIGKNGRYYNLRWERVDGTRGKTTGGTTLDQARWKASQVSAYESSAAGPLAVTRLDMLVTAYLAEGRSPYGRKRPWRSSYRNQTEDQLLRTIRGFEHYRAMDVTRELVDQMRAQGGTPRMVQQNTTAWRGLLKWGYARKEPYFTAAQSELLPQGAVNPLPALVGTEMPERRDRVRQVGEHEDYVRPEDAPSAPQVMRLGRALARRFPAWGRLAPELAANCGPRWGEQFQLTADDVHLDGCGGRPDPHFHIDWQIDAGAKAGTSRRITPKGNKTRLAPIAPQSFTGYALLDQLRHRVAAAYEERVAGTNPEALLFPAPRGGLLWHSAWASDYLLPAMREAGWPLTDWTERRDEWSAQTHSYTQLERNRTMAELTWHSLRHRFARIAIDTYHCDSGELMALGGWENKATVDNRYYESGLEHTLSGLGLFSGRSATRIEGTYSG